MQITVVCPSCETPWHIDASFRGVRMRCPNAHCRAIFEANEQRSRSNPPPALPQQTGSVGDMVPILPAEPAPDDGAPAPPAVEPRSWHD
ncbi:MAG TPA: hypothetical protein VJ739_01065, partial [Gemmataceae bacterium]|nr:hypothetical protein [Gemmataceae bacterium]